MDTFLADPPWLPAGCAGPDASESCRCEVLLKPKRRRVVSLEIGPLWLKATRRELHIYCKLKQAVGTVFYVLKKPELSFL